MPLNGADVMMGIELETAYYTARDDGSEGTDVIPTLAQDVSNAIHAYMLEALVTTNVDVDTGQPDSVAGTSQTPGTGMATGELS